MNSRRLPTREAESPADRVRHGGYGALTALVIGLSMTQAFAACTPSADDGVMLARGGLILAYRPLLAGDGEVPLGRIPLAKHFTLEVQLCDRGGVSGARLDKADATMPEHRHGMNYRPVITSMGSGRFRVEGLMFHMAGRWELVFEVRSGKETARLTHDVQIE